LSIVFAIIAFCVIIIVHEIGHYSAAKLFKMKVYEFSIGMGPRILKKQKGETLYSIKAFPIGGSVMLGEDIEPTEDPRDFRNKPIWQRMIVIAAGAILNFVLGFVLCIVMSIVNPIGTMTVASFNEGSVSNTGTSALQVNDQIVSVNGMRTFIYSDISYKLLNSVSKGDDENFAVYEFEVIRNGEKVKLPNVKFAAEPNERGGMSYVHDFKIFRAEKNVFSVISYSFRSAVSQGRIIWLSLMDLIRGTYGLNELSGPIGIVATIDEIAKQAPTFGEQMMVFISISAFISINVGVLNLLPIPALDGARLIFFVIEAIRRKPLKAEVEGVIHFVGFALLMLLMLVVTFNDIRKLIFGDG